VERKRSAWPKDQVGLCASCVYSRLLESSRGSVFYFCERSKDEPEEFPKYPRLPVVVCRGYEPIDRTEAKVIAKPDS